MILHRCRVCQVRRSSVANCAHSVEAARRRLATYWSRSLVNASSGERSQSGSPPTWMLFQTIWCRVTEMFVANGASPQVQPSAAGPVRPCRAGEGVVLLARALAR